MKRLIVELKPLVPVMVVTVTMGVIGFLAAIAITTFGAVALATTFDETITIAFKSAIIIMIIAAVLRGILRYVEQLSGHYIAFKILVILRDKIFTALRKLAPAKLENKEKGNLVSLVTSDIELLEVFYAHTIAPIMIAIITNMIVTVCLYKINPILGILGGIFFFIVGFIIPYVTSKIGQKSGVQYREAFGQGNSYLLDSLRGLKEILIYKDGENRRKSIHRTSEELNKKQEKIKLHEGLVRATTDLTIMIAILTFLYVGTNLVAKGTMSFGNMIIAIVILGSSFGPVVALSNLSNNLLLTFASAQRLFNLLDEVPEVSEVEGQCKLKSLDIYYKDVAFGYKGRDTILDNVNLTIKKGEKISIVGESGIGKSTFAKVLMRFFDVNKGQVLLGEKDLKNLPTKALRENQVLMSQETFLFNDTIKENIRLAKLGSSEEEIIKASKKAAIHDFIVSLPKGYDTKVGELGGKLSSGEKQRIGLARAFLSEGSIMILDEPTSNLDTLNEGEILKAIEDNTKERTILLITHRKSTASITNKVFTLKKKNLIEV